ncbi:2-amino-4-hydroxy-6-hydroxymethyldihydropteridine diphosphokinase [Hymenobacter busanensis]|uniref:2-amino-4-hydroxy-6-hydroxymethyldihydropteridine pyrophosphokinase n=1 Tax=Hymenobacter busanensis TaxID=2607656 RepID=A0A7L4ZUG7_9BACT|nr:2-amino-4-hydroxy-6-hydroxymethyldihydropteridine diphosphokinase [Hymenobacter busanensis]KAA9339129.1 2-amino-4-hydroxy-6-hydroxymethyldihydropteridine diphosphokinase [Hymenobacter busanensis]QHJ07109.1 2-amino-4-hydroxy-6-hydroxymethyldihydropteridine diphosphokinase [Hymenobacter busanensis]
MNHTAYLLLGSNLGDRVATLHRALVALAEQAGKIVAVSSVYETAAWGFEAQPAFLNQAVQFSTALSPEALLGACQQVEQEAGREREELWGPRTLDVDILLYDEVVLDQPRLVLPHPRLPNRRFALVPLADLAPNVMHPTLNQSVQQLLANCPDTLPVEPWLGDL